MQLQEELMLDPAIRDWVLLPIMLVMVLIGVLRHYLTLWIQSSSGSTGQPWKQIRESQQFQHIRQWRQWTAYLPSFAWEARRRYFDQSIQQGQFLFKKPATSGDSPDAAGAPPNPMSDPAQMEVMMEGMKKNMVMMIPQMIMMGWVTYFFSGFVLIRLPFPLTLRFKAMLQRGIETQDMDVAWVSSLSWYFLNLFGLRGIFALILGEGNAADGMQDMQNMAQMQQQQQMGQVQDMQKLFQGEKEAVDLTVHVWYLQDVEQRLMSEVRQYHSPSVDIQQKKVQ